MTIWYVEALDAYYESRIQDLHGPYKKYKRAIKKATKLVNKYDFCSIYPYTNKGFGTPIEVEVKTEIIFNDYPRVYKVHRTYIDDKLIKEKEEIQYSCGWPKEYYVRWKFGKGSNQYIKFLDHNGGELIKRDPNALTFMGTVMW